MLLLFIYFFSLLSDFLHNFYPDNTTWYWIIVINSIAILFSFRNFLWRDWMTPFWQKILFNLTIKLFLITQFQSSVHLWQKRKGNWSIKSYPIIILNEQLSINSLTQILYGIADLKNVKKRLGSILDKVVNWKRISHQILSQEFLRFSKKN